MSRIFIGIILTFLCIAGLPVVVAQKPEVVCDTARLTVMLADASAAGSDNATGLYHAVICDGEECLKKGGSKAFREAVKVKIIRARLDLGLLLYRKLDYPAAMEQYRQALSDAEALGNTLLMAESNFNIAEIYLEQSQFGEAMDYYRLSLAGYEKAGDAASQFWCYTGMGIVQKQSANYRDAVNFYTTALQMAKELELTYEEAICYNNLGSVYLKTGEFAMAMESYQKAIEVFRKLDDEAAVSDCLNNIGNLFSDHSDPFRALEYYRQSLEIAKRLNDEYRLIIRSINMAGAYLALNDFDNARQFLDDGLALSEKSGYKSFLASCNMLYGKLHEIRNDPIIASAYYRKSADLYAETGEKAEQGEALIALSASLLSRNENREALKYAEEALRLAESTGSLKGRLNASLMLASCYEKEEKPARAFAFLKTALALKDSIYTADKYRAIEEIEAGFQHSELKKQNEMLNQLSTLQKQAIRTRNIIMLLLVISLLLGLALIWLVFRRAGEARREAGRIRQMSDERISQLNQDLDSKERELTTKTVFINQKNQLLEKLIAELEELKNSEVSAQSVQQLQMRLKRELSPNAWKEFEIQFNEVHPGFQARLLRDYPDLTPAERRLCAFIRLDMNTREVSSLTGQSIKSIEVARTRIRKKLGVPHEQNLTNFIAQL